MLEQSGMKYDGGKPRVDLLVAGVPNALQGMAEVLTFGAKKYAAHSWQTVPEGAERYLAAGLRHLLAIQKGEEFDEESGLPHYAHLMCNIAFITELYYRGKNIDNDSVQKGGVSLGRITDRGWPNLVTESPEAVQPEGGIPKSLRPYAGDGWRSKLCGALDTVDSKGSNT